MAIDRNHQYGVYSRISGERPRKEWPKQCHLHGQVTETIHLTFSIGYFERQLYINTIHACLLWSWCHVSNFEAVKAHWGRKSLITIYGPDVLSRVLHSQKKRPNSNRAFGHSSRTGPKSAHLVLYRGLGYVLVPLWARLVLIWKTYL